MPIRTLRYCRLWGRNACRRSGIRKLRGSREDRAMSLLSFLDRNHTIAKPGFSRWMVPPAALCVHLCIGQAYAFSVFNLPMTKLHRHHAIGAGRLEAHRARLDLLDRDLLPRRLGGRVRPLGRGRRTAQGDVHRGAVLGRRLLHLGDRRLRPQALADLSRLRRARRHRGSASATSRRSRR